MAIYSKIVKPLIDDVNIVQANPAKYWSLILSWTLCFAIAVSDNTLSLTLSLLYKDSIFNGKLGLISIVCGCSAVLIAEFVDILKLKYKCHSFKIFHYILMLLLNEATTGILLFYLWSFAISTYQSLDGWKAVLFISIIYFVVLFVALNVFNHLALIYHTIKRTKNNQLKFSGPLRALVCIITCIFLIGSVVFVFNSVSQKLHLIEIQTKFWLYVILATYFLSHGEEATVQSRLIQFVQSAKEAIHPLHLYIPMLLIAVAQYCYRIYRDLTVSKIVLDFEAEQSETMHDPWHNFLSVTYFIFIFSIVRDIWLKSTIEDDLRSGEDRTNNNSKKIETDV